MSTAKTKFVKFIEEGVFKVNQARIEKIRESMKQAGLKQIIVTETEPVYYLTGIWVDPVERMMAFYLDDEGRTIFFGNQLFAVPRQEGLEFQEHTDIDNPVAQLAAAVHPGELGIDDTWPSHFLIELMKLRPDVKPVKGSAVVEQVTMCKDEEEREKMRKASLINDACMDMVIHSVKEGVTERELAEKVQNFFKEHKCNSIGFHIVGSSANGADPHHGADDTVIKAGDSIVLDIGAPFEHYWCDMTRTIFFKSVTDEQREVYETVRRANAAAIALIKPGVKFKDLDLAARKVIEDAGYGEYFTHRTGHSIGMKEHERPSVASDCEVLTRPGMVFSIEPGIYLPGKFGVRIEDLVLVTEDGCEVLNKYSKDLIVVD